LGIAAEKISVKDNFFEIGGHSLKATRLVSRIDKEFEVKITLKQLFGLPVLEMLAQLIQETGKTSFLAILPAKNQLCYAMSSSQRRLWVLSQLEEGSSAYNMPGIYIFEGELNQDALKLSFNSLLERHEILRTVFKEDELGEIRQFILPAEGFGVFYDDLRGEADQEENIWNRVQEISSRSFDLAKGPLVRAGLYRAAENKWVFVYVMHHIISDGWSMGVLIKELLLLYKANNKGEANPLLPLKIQYKDYAVWQQQQLNDESFHVHKDYWLKQFEGELPVMELPGDHIRPAVKTYNGNTVHQRLDRELTAGLKKISQEQGATLFMGLLTLVNALLYRYTGQEDMIIGSPIAGREHADLEEQIGFYVNTLALRSRFKGTDSFKDLLDHVKQVTLDAYEHQIYPFDELVDALELQYDMSRNTLFDVMVELQNNEISGTKEQQLENLAISGYKGTGGQSSKFELTFGFAEIGDELQIIIEYNTDLFENPTIIRLINHLEQLLRAVIENPSNPIEQLDYLSTAEKQVLLVNFNDTLTAYPADKTMISFFEEQVEKTPDQIALIFNQTELTYRELNAKSNQLANYLQQKYQVQGDDLIAVMLERSEMMVIAILAIFKSGGAYVPIDPDYPKERVDFILADCSSKVLLNAQELKLFAEEDEEYDTRNLIPVYGPDNLAYVIYTSGSTGKPKGTMIEHRGMLNHLLAMVDELELNSTSRIAQNASFTFDISVWQLLNAVIIGGCTVIYDQATILDPLLFIESVISNEITILQVVPSYLKIMLDIIDQDKRLDLNGLKYLLVTGEAVNQQLLKRWFNIFPAIKVVNAYGPAEAADDITLYIMDKAPETVNIPVGKPIQNMKIYILDRLQNLCPIGLSGEIYVSGIGVGRAYLNDQEKTAYSFMIDPFQIETGVRMYRTGDHGRWNAEGNVEFIGRKDEQVKIRGYRIELGDIENALLQHPQIEETAVIAKKEKNDEKSLVAYLVSNGKLNIEELRIYLGGLLPAYMLPAYFIELDEMPLNANGKVDKKILLEVEGSDMNSGILFVAPRNQTELKLTGIWGDVLGIPANKISIKDNFFDIGGHSLKATRLVSQIHKEFGVKIALKDLFNASVLETQAFLIQQSSKTSLDVIPVVSLQSDYPLSSSQRRLWVLSQFEEGNIAYNMPGIHVFVGKLDQLAFEFSFQSLLERHEILRTLFREDQHGEIRQTVLSLEEAAFGITYQDLREENNQQEKIRTLVQKELTRPFDLAAGPLVRAGLLQTENNKWVFIYTMHHIISDGWSMNILISELLHFYNTYSTGQTPALSPLRIQYKDYAGWQQQQLSGESLIAHRDYWLEQFAGEIPVLDLPADSIRPTVKTYHGGFVNQTIDSSASKGLKHLIQEQGGTLFMGLLAVVNVLLHRYSGQEDLIVGSPIAGRENIDLEDQIGFYVNTLALRSRFKGTDSFKDLLDHVKQVTLDAYAHQVFPFDELVDALQLQRDMSRSPLFDVMLVLQNNGGGNEKEQQLGELSISAYEGGENQTSRFDLTFDFIEIGEEIQFSVNYNSDIFSRDSAIGFAAHLKHLLGTIVASPDQAIGKLDYLFAAEKAILLDAFNTTTVAYPEDKTITALFEAQVNSTPEHTALVFGDISLSYRELNARANQFGAYLQGKYSIAAGDLVGIKLERSS
ncbi:amino acid adenylation domain-containing protein, partial [Pedobacter cryoconitis]